MNKKRTIQILALVVVFSMIFTTAAFAAMSPNGMPFGQAKKLERTQNTYQEAAKYMKEKQIMFGYGKDTSGEDVFGFTDYVKRGDIAVMIARAFKLSVTIDTFTEDFLDVGDSDYFYEAIMTAKKLGIVKGTDGKNFNPNKLVTVEEAILMVERSVSVANNNVMLGFEELYDDFDPEEIGDELRDIFKNELKDYATRQDIALMLYYVLTGEEYDGEVDEEKDIKDITYTIEEDDDYVTFNDADFTKAFNVEDEEFEYVRFIFPVKNGTLYYDYDEDASKNTLVDENTKYYDGSSSDHKLIDKVTFVPKDGYSGTTYILYKVTTDDDNTYKGLIKITVNVDEEEEEDFEELSTIKYSMDENTLLRFKESSFNSILDEFKFEVPSKVKMYYNVSLTDNDFDDSGDYKIDNDDEFEDEDLDHIVFVPNADFTGKVEVKYTAYDGEDAYEGIVQVTVKEVQEIPTMKLSVDEEDDDNLVFDFEDELDDLTDNDEIFTQDVFNALDNVQFELPDQGTLQIKTGSSFVNVNKSTKYDLSDIISMKYIQVEDTDTADDIVTINFKAFDGTKEYDGVIEITVED
ncbi:MAG: S-layer homology domain-containing protein [Sedimentibacter sp.]|uniref:S-layer homology domain-containing protein n=1 Tax=Sedimentibacter sp. TaxID=1960295 RepID=UPI00315907E5